MSELIVKYPDRNPDHFPLGRLRITIGRSARNDLCIPDPFASRVHAEVRREGDEYLLQDLGSANGTLYNGATVQGVVPLTAGGRIQIRLTLSGAPAWENVEIRHRPEAVPGCSHSTVPKPGSPLTPRPSTWSMMRSWAAW